MNSLKLFKNERIEFGSLIIHILVGLYGCIFIHFVKIMSTGPTFLNTNRWNEIMTTEINDTKKIFNC